MRFTLAIAVPLLILAFLSGCGSSGTPAAVADTLQVRVEKLDQGGARAVRGERLIEPQAVGRFYAARQGRPAWQQNSRVESVLDAIRGIEQDGLTPADYHLEAIQGMVKDRSDDAGREADLDLLVSDAVAALLDHVRYGRVRPVKLDPAWNVNPRAGAPPLEQTLAEVAEAGDPAKAIDQAKPQHFIYKGLVGALARMRKIAADGGWPTVPVGRTVKPGGRDARIPIVRARLAVTGEYKPAALADSLRYDPALVAAVRRFQQEHRLNPDAVLDKTSLGAMNVSASSRAAQVRVNLERARWVIGGLSNDFMLVNLPAFKAYLIRGGRNVWESRTQIGQSARQTPEFRADLRVVEFNPDWTVPPTILEQDVLERMRRGDNVLAKEHLTIYDGQGREVDPSSIDWATASADHFPYTLRQPPGEDAALGRVKFLFPNHFQIYLHDTPHRELFQAENRTFSSGCIRLERPLELAERLLAGQDGWGPAKIQSVLATHKTQEVKLEHPLPILIVYWTVSVGASGDIHYAQDVYGRDNAVYAALRSSPS